MENTEGSLQFRMPESNNETRGRLSDGLGSDIMVSVDPVIILRG
jgi:hypothetical protein